MGEGWSDWLGLMVTIEDGDLGSDAQEVSEHLFLQKGQKDKVFVQHLTARTFQLTTQHTPLQTIKAFLALTELDMFGLPLYGI